MLVHYILSFSIMTIVCHTSVLLKFGFSALFPLHFVLGCILVFPSLYEFVSFSRTRGSGHKLECRRFHLNAWKHFCAVQEQWYRPAHRGHGFSSLGPGHPAVGVPAGAGPGTDGPRGPCQPQLF